MPISCVAYGCSSRANNGQDLSFFRFPKDKLLYKKWILAVRRKNFVPTSSSRLCSMHFTSESYDKTKPDKPVLKKDAVPTLFRYSRNKRKRGLMSSDEFMIRKFDYLLGTPEQKQKVLGKMETDDSLGCINDLLHILKVEHNQNSGEVDVTNQRKEVIETYIDEFGRNVENIPPKSTSTVETKILQHLTNNTSNQSLDKCIDASEQSDEDMKPDISEISEVTDIIKILDVHFDVDVKVTRTTTVKNLRTDKSVSGNETIGSIKWQNVPLLTQKPNSEPLNNGNVLCTTTIKNTEISSVLNLLQQTKYLLQKQMETIEQQIQQVKEKEVVKKVPEIKCDEKDFEQMSKRQKVMIESEGEEPGASSNQILRNVDMKQFYTILRYSGTGNNSTSLQVKTDEESDIEDAYLFPSDELEESYGDDETPFPCIEQEECISEEESQLHIVKVKYAKNDIA